MVMNVCVHCGQWISKKHILEEFDTDAGDDPEGFYISCPHCSETALVATNGRSGPDGRNETRVPNGA